MIQQDYGKKIAWTILASNPQAGLLIMWEQPPANEAQVREEMLRLANSVRITQKSPAP